MGEVTEALLTVNEKEKYQQLHDFGNLKQENLSSREYMTLLMTKHHELKAIGMKPKWDQVKSLLLDSYEYG